MQDINLNRIWNEILKSFIPWFRLMGNPFSNPQLFSRNMLWIIKIYSSVYKAGNIKFLKTKAN
jgi:hypothetical protein